MSDHMPSRLTSACTLIMGTTSNTLEVTCDNAVQYAHPCQYLEVITWRDAEKEMVSELVSLTMGGTLEGYSVLDAHFHMPARLTSACTLIVGTTSNTLEVTCDNAVQYAHPC